MRAFQLLQKIHKNKSTIKNTFSPPPPKNEVKNEHKKYIILKKL